MAAAEEKPGFEIEGKRYPFPEEFRLGDPVLVSELTGLDFEDFAERLDDPERRGNPVVLIGLVGVAVWQGNPRWTRARVIEYVQRIDLGKFDSYGGEVGGEAKEAGPASPPDGPASEPASSSDSSTGSTTSPDGDSE